MTFKGNLTAYIWCLSLALLALLIGLKVFQEKKLTESFTPIAPLNSPHLLPTFFLNLLYHHLKPQVEIPNSVIRPYLSDFVVRPDPDLDLFYLPKRQRYCQANFLHTVLNAETATGNYVFMDSPNTNKLKKRLSSRFDFLNTPVHKTKELKKTDITRLQNMEWNPKIKIFFTSTNFNYNNKLGSSHACMFQSTNHLPGTGFLHRQDLLSDNLKNFAARGGSEHCFSPYEFYPLTFRLYRQKECQEFFKILKSENFRRETKDKTLYTLKNINSNTEEKLDHIEIHKLNTIYRKGKLCGKIRHKRIAQRYLLDQMRYKKGKKFTLRVFMTVVSAKPLVVTFHRGYVLLNRFNTHAGFNSSILRPSTLLKYLKKTNLLNEDEFEALYGRIKKILAKINWLSMDEYLKDPRFFQNIAFDFAISRRKRPVLVDVKGSPYFSSKNFNFVQTILKLENEILQRRIASLRAFAQSALLDFYNLYQRQTEPIRYYEDLVSQIKKGIDFEKLTKNFEGKFHNTLPDLKAKEYADLELIYDEREEGRKAYKGLLSKYCGV